MAINLGLGLKSLIGFAPEATWGATFTSPTHFSRVISLTPNNKTTTATDPEMTEDMDTGVYWMINDAGCDIVMNNLYDGEQLFWHSLLGTYTYSDLVVAEEGLHAFTYDPTGDHDFLPGLAIGACFFEAPETADSRWIGMNGGHVTKAVIEGDANDFLRTTFTLAGKAWKVAGAAGYTPTYPARRPVLGVHGGTAGGTFIIGNTAVKASDWRVTLEVPRAEGRYHYGESAVAEPVRVDKLRGTVEATIELDITTSAGWDLYKQAIIEPETAQTVQTLTIIHDNGELISSSQNYRFTIDGDFLVMGDSPTISDAGIVTFNLRGNLVNNGNDIIVSMANGTSAKVVA